MAGFFNLPTEVVKLDDANQLTVRGLSWGERQAIAMAAAQKCPSNQTAAGVVMSSEAAKVVIVSWEGPGFDGRDVSSENIEALPAWIIDKVAEASDRLSEPPSDEQKKASGAPTKS